MNARVFSYPSMGTEWKLTVWDQISEQVFKELVDSIVKKSNLFDATYSRFKKDSFVSLLSQKTGIVSVEEDFMNMLSWYFKFYIPSGKKLNPLIGFTISDLGYDAEYSLIAKKEIRKTPDLFETVKIIDGTTIEIKEPVLFDFGALGKGYFVDVIADFLRNKGIQRFLVDGSGDILYEGNGVAIEIGLEHPLDSRKVIGIVSMKQGAMCSSGTNRRRWANSTHMIDPHVSASVPENILSSWVIGEKAVFTDGVATGLFFSTPESLKDLGEFEYCLLNTSLKVKKSKEFKVKLFT